MSDTPVKERRAHERQPTTFDLHGTADGGAVVARMVARNLSIGGLYCTSSSEFPEMTRLAVRLMLPIADSSEGDAVPVEVEAIVVRCEKLPSSATNGEDRYEFALFFTRFDDADRRQLQRYLDQRS